MYDLLRAVEARSGGESDPKFRAAREDVAGQQAAAIVRQVIGLEDWPQQQQASEVLVRPGVFDSKITGETLSR